MLRFIISLTLSFAYSLSLNPILNGIPRIVLLNEQTTIKNLIADKICDIVQIKLASTPNKEQFTEDTVTLICPQNTISQKNTFLNLEFRNEKLLNINLLIPLNNNSLNSFIETNPDWISKNIKDALVRDKLKTTIYNSSKASVDYLLKSQIVNGNLNFKKLDEFLLRSIIKKSLPFVEKGRKRFFDGQTTNSVWQWFDPKSSTKGSVSYNNELDSKLVIITIETKIFDQESFL